MLAVRLRDAGGTLAGRLWDACGMMVGCGKRLVNGDGAKEENRGRVRLILPATCHECEGESPVPNMSCSSHSIPLCHRLQHKKNTKVKPGRKLCDLHLQHPWQAALFKLPCSSCLVQHIGLMLVLFKILLLLIACCSRHCCGADANAFGEDDAKNYYILIREKRFQFQTPIFLFLRQEIFF